MQVEEVMSDTMSKSKVLGGLRKEFDPDVTLSNFSEQEVHTDRLIRLLLNFERTHNKRQHHKDETVFMAKDREKKMRKLWQHRTCQIGMQRECI